VFVHRNVLQTWSYCDFLLHQLSVVLWKHNRGRNEVQVAENRFVILRQGAITISLYGLPRNWDLGEAVKL
jgi:hypothetical protein